MAIATTIIIVIIITAAIDIVVTHISDSTSLLRGDFLCIVFVMFHSNINFQQVQCKEIDIDIGNNLCDRSKTAEAKLRVQW